MAELINAIAKLLGAVAWPIVALVAGLIFRKELGDLLGRVRKGAGVEFDPPSQLDRQASAAQSTARAIAAVSNLRTPTVQEWEATLAAPIANVPSGPDREATLLTMAARAVVLWVFEQLENSIWASQLQILAHLNGQTDEALSVLKEAFFEPASRANVEWFANYSFESYIGFLSGQGLITVEPGERAQITPKGRDYLAWRVEFRKPLKIHG